MTPAHEIMAAFATLVFLGMMIAAAVMALVAAIETRRRWNEEKRRVATDMSTNESHPYHDEIKPDQEQRYADWLARAQDAITKLSKERADGIVSTDDIWDICPPPAGVEPRALGALWAPRSRWLKIDYVASRRTECHKRPIARWRYIRQSELAEAAE